MIHGIKAENKFQIYPIRFGNETIDSMVFRIELFNNLRGISQSKLFALHPVRNNENQPVALVESDQLNMSSDWKRRLYTKAVLPPSEHK